MEEDQQTPPSLEIHNHRLDETSRVFSEAQSSTDHQSDFCCSAGGSDCMEQAYPYQKKLAQHLGDKTLNVEDGLGEAVDKHQDYHCCLLDSTTIHLVKLLVHYNNIERKFVNHDILCKHTSLKLTRIRVISSTQSLVSIIHAHIENMIHILYIIVTTTALS